ncbi:uncharacterized protein [Miscanthus floridulus]|uniref:uncharacterized protein n=1 Tax=Miscanthus floridulus TaxID=154761 RepID=UPI00345904EA
MQHLPCTERFPKPTKNNGTKADNHNGSKADNHNGSKADNHNGTSLYLGGRGVTRREHGEDGAGNGTGRQPPSSFLIPPSSPSSFLSPFFLLLHRSFGGAWRGRERWGSGRQGRVRHSSPVAARRKSAAGRVGAGLDAGVGAARACSGGAGRGAGAARAGAAGGVGYAGSPRVVRARAGVGAARAEAQWQCVRPHAASKAARARAGVGAARAEAQWQHVRPRAASKAARARAGGGAARGGAPLHVVWRCHGF